MTKIVNWKMKGDEIFYEIDSYTIFNKRGIMMNIDAKGVYYKELNERVRQAVLASMDNAILETVYPET